MLDYFIIYYVICLIWYVIFICAILYLSVVDSMPYKPKFKDKIYTKIPSKLNPGELSNLMYKKMSSDVFTATIMFLVKKGILSLKRTKDDFVITLVKPKAGLSHSQQTVVDILIKDMGEKGKVTFKQIENYSKSSQNCSEFLLNYQMWDKLMIKESNEKSFYEDKIGYKLVKNVRLFGILLFIMNILLGFHSLLGYFIIIPACFIALYFYKIYKRTEEANEEYMKWLAFKRYLNNIEKYEYKKENIGNYIICGLILKIPDLEKKLNDFHCVEKLNDLIRHNVIMATLRGNRSIKFK